MQCLVDLNDTYKSLTRTLSIFRNFKDGEKEPLTTLNKLLAIANSLVSNTNLLSHFARVIPGN